MSYGTDSCTDEVRFRKVYWKNSLDQLFIIDSPGLNDSKYRDPQIIAKLAVIRLSRMRGFRFKKTQIL